MSKTAAAAEGRGKRRRRRCISSFVFRLDSLKKYAQINFVLFQQKKI